MHQITVTIGRRDNVNGLELSEVEWTSFVASVASVLPERYEVVVSSEGYGQWEGVGETNHVFVAVASGDGICVSQVARERRNLRADLQNLALVYDQDSIALGIGTSELVESVPAS